MRKNRLSKNVLAVIIFFIVILLGYFYPMNYPWRVQKIQSSLDHLYVDNHQEVLSEQVTILDVHNLFKEANRLRGDENVKFKNEAQVALEKFRNRQKLESVLDGDFDALLEEKSEIIFKNSLTTETWESTMPLMKWTKNDTYNQLITNLSLRVNEEWEKINNVSTTLEKLPENIGDTEDDIVKHLDMLNALDTNLSKIKKHPQYMTYYKPYQVIVLSYLDQLVKKQEKNGSITYSIKETALKNTLMQKKIYKEDLDLRPKVALTFDDGPNETFTPQVLDILDKYKIKATFFMVGHNVGIVPNMAKEVRERGHIIGNHSFSHPNLAALEDDAVLEEIQLTQDIIEDATGFVPTMYRMPFGDGGKRVYELVDNLDSIMWNADSNDWYLQDPQEIYAFLEPNLSKDNIIILMHDTHPQTIGVLDDVIMTLSKRHYKFVTPDQIDYDEKYREY